MLVHVKRTRSHRNGERARVERRHCSGKTTAIDDQIEPGRRRVLLVRRGSASAVALRRRTADGGRGSDQLAWGGRARDTAVADILQMRDLCLVSASLISFFPGSCTRWPSCAVSLF